MPDYGPQLRAQQLQRRMMAAVDPTSPYRGMYGGGRPILGGGTDLESPAFGFSGAYGQGSLAGAPGHTGAGPYGLVPQAPDPRATQMDAIGGNLAALPQILSLASQYNAFNTQQAQAPYIANQPLYLPNIQQASTNIQAGLQGQLPPDVVRFMTQQAAERGIGRGVNTGTSSPNLNADLMRAIGITSLQRSDLANQQLTEAIRRTPVGQLYDPSRDFITNEQQQAAQNYANQLAAAPDPTLAAQENLRALMAGRNYGQGATGLNTGPLSPVSSTFKPPTLPQVANYAPRTPIKQGRAYDPNAYSGGYNTATGESWGMTMPEMYSPDLGLLQEMYPGLYAPDSGGGYDASIPQDVQGWADTLNNQGGGMDFGVPPEDQWYMDYFGG